MDQVKFVKDSLQRIWSNLVRLNLLTAIFYQIFISHQMRALQKLWKMLFISFKKLFSFSRYSNFCLYFRLPLFFFLSHCFRGWSKINHKFIDVTNCLNKDLITHFVWHLEKVKRYDIETLSIDGVLNKEHFYWKIMHRMCTRGQFQNPF